MKLAVGIVHGETVDSWFHTSLTNLLTQRLTNLTDELLPLWDVIHVRSGPALQVGRGLLVDTFLDQSDADVLLMLDSDMSFTPQTIYQMWDAFNTLPHNNGANAKILGGLAFIAAPGFLQPNIWVAHPGEPDDLLATFTYPDDQLLQVTATGAACLMVHREVFEKIAAEQGRRGIWFAHHVLPDGSELGEDLSFCRRANTAGYPIFLHTALKFGHTKSMVITEHDYLGAPNG